MSSPTSKKPVVTPRQAIRGHTHWIRGIVHLPDGRHIITGSYDGSLRLWELESGAQVGRDWRDEGDKAGVDTIALSPNGNTVASGSEDGTVRLWDVKTGDVIAKWTGHTYWVRSVCWSGDGERVLSGSKDGTATVWDVKNGESVFSSIETGHDYVWAVMYSPDSTKFATGGRNNGAKIWDAKTGELLATLEHDKYHVVCSLAWTSDGKKLISGAHHLVRIFDTATRQQIAILKSHTKYLNGISLFRNDRLLASTSDDHTARLWNLDTNLPVGPPLPHENDVVWAAFSADGKVLVTGCYDHNAYVWDVYAILKEAGLEDLLSIPDVTTAKSLMDSDATRRPAQLKDARRLPQGFFDDARDGVRFSATRGIHHCSSAHPRRTLASSLGSPHALLDHLPSFFRRSHSNTGEATELQQRPTRTIFSPRGPRTVEVAAVRDKQTLFVARRPERDRDKAKRTQQQRSQSQGQAQAPTLQTQPAAASTSKSPPAPATSTTTSDPAGTQSRPPPLWARFVLCICCASPPHANGH